MKEVYLVKYQHYGEDQYFNTFDYYRAVDYAAQHKGVIYRCKEWLAIEDRAKRHSLCVRQKRHPPVNRPQFLCENPSNHV